MGQPIAVKNLGTYKDTNLEGIVEAYNIVINSDIELITVYIRVKLVSPVSNEVIKEVITSYNRFNKQAVFYAPGDIITPAVKNEEGVIVTPAVIAVGTELRVEANLKFDALRGSQVGQLIEGLILNDLNSIESIDTIDLDLKQD